MKNYKYFAQHMHMHSCYQPGASMEGHMYHAANLGMKYIWLTDHDIRMGRKPFQIDDFDFEQNALFFTEENGLSQGFKVIEAKQDACQVELTQETCFQGTQCLKLTACSDSAQWNGGGVYFWSSKKRHCSSLLAGIKLGIAVMQEKSENSRVILDITLSQRPPEHECAHLMYVIGSTDGMKKAPHTAIIPLTPEKGWHKYILDLSGDVLKQKALECGVGGLDNAFDTISIIMETRNGTASAYFDALSIQVEKKAEAVRTVQKTVAEEIGKHYGVTPFVGTEITEAGPHKNCFTTSVPIIPYDEYDYKMSHEEAIAWVNRHGGIFALNHPFEKFKDEKLDERDKEECLAWLTEEFIKHKAWGASLMEVGFPLGRNNFSLEMHLRLWDKLTESGIFLTGYGSSDNHSNRGSWYDGNNFANWLGVKQEEEEPVSEAAFVEAMRNGRIYTGNPVVLKGDIRFETEEGSQMGSVLVVDKSEKDLIIRFACDNAASGWKFRLIYNGKPVVEEVVDEGNYEYVYTMKLEEKVNFVRAELYDADEVCIMLTNPIHALRSDL